MKTKKLLSLALSGAMALSLAVPAFAADPTEDEANTGNLSTAISGSYKETEIDVAVPQTGEVFVNPYGLAATATKSDNTTKVALAGEVMSVPLSIRNRSTSYLSIGASASVVIPDTSGIKLATEALADDATGKTIYAQLEVVQAPASVTGAESALKDLVIDASANEDNWAGSGKVVLNSRSAAAGENLAIIKPATMDNNGAFASYAPGSVALFRISGDCAAVSSRDPWDAENDTFTVNVTFNFAPYAPTTYAITKGEIAKKSGDTTVQDVTSWSIDGTKVAEGDTVTIQVVKQHEDDFVTFTITGGPDGTAPITIAKSKGTAVASDASGKTVTYTFTMPAYAVTVNGEVSAN